MMHGQKNINLQINIFVVLEFDVVMCLSTPVGFFLCFINNDCRPGDMKFGSSNTVCLLPLIHIY
jgi:hypothetical protein